MTKKQNLPKDEPVYDADEDEWHFLGDTIYSSEDFDVEPLPSPDEIFRDIINDKKEK